jgi:hypothetical protein
MLRGDDPCYAVSRSHVWSGEHALSLHHALRRDLDMLGKGDEEGLVAGDVFEYPCEKAGIVGGGTDRLRTEAGQRQEPSEPLAVARQPGKRLNAQAFCRFPGDSINSRHQSMFSIP